jgi:type IV pilus assembly protein PilA
MSLLKAYLSRPSTQRALSRKPGQDGFSLIELVVVVAVLAILSAIAIPQFSSLSDDARLNSAKSIITNMYKECEFNKARTGTGSHTDSATLALDGVTWGGQLASGTTTCVGDGHAELPGVAARCFLISNLSDGARSHDDAANIGAVTKETGWPANSEDCD